MNDAFYIAATGMRSEERAVQTVADNIANLNTPSFKRGDVRFAELVAPTSSGMLDQDSAITQLGGVRAFDANRDQTPGEVRKTGDALDLGIQGQGFIELVSPDQSPLLWRGGHLRIGSDGQFETSDGSVLRAAIKAPAGAQNIVIDRSGVVTAEVDGVRKALGAIDLVLAERSELASLGGGLYKAANSSNLVQTQPGADGAGYFAQGYLEASNVNLSNEMVSLMVMQRAFAANSQVLQAADQLMAIANGLKK